MRIRPIITLLGFLLICSAVCAETPVSQVSVRDYGAKGDSVTDDTAAFTSAMSAVAEKGGTVSVPVGNYLIKTHLRIPNNVTLEGVWSIPTAFSQMKGSTLLAVEGAGSETGPAFITLGVNSTLKGMTVFYPDQKPDKIVPYPWCVACAGETIRPS
ncbi:MAG: glycosyl hydrolase family 28-related protein [Armatimonadetes bacterium]|nr:glycosyl hydrolase family 28-related protein [Armatimonadota bacterium]